MPLPHLPFGHKKPKPLDLTKADFLLFRGCKDNNLEAVQKALSMGARPNARGPEKETPICVAAFNGHCRVMRVLACVGADVNVMDKYRGTPLHLAAFNGHMEAVLTLLALKANPRASNTKHQYPYEVASKDNIKVILQTFRPKKGRTLMHYACENGNLALVEWIIRGRFGNAVTAWDRDHNAPLHIASSKGFYEICKALLMAGADRNIYNKGKQLPINVAKTDAVKHLLETYEHHKAAREIEQKREAIKAAQEQEAEEEEEEESEDEDEDDEDHGHGDKLALDPFDEFVWARAKSPPPSNATTSDLLTFDEDENGTVTPSVVPPRSTTPSDIYAHFSDQSHWDHNNNNHHNQQSQQQQQQQQQAPLSAVDGFKKRKKNRVKTWSMGAAPIFDPFGNATTAAPNNATPVNSTPVVVSPTPTPEPTTEKHELPPAAVQAITQLKKTKRAMRQSWSPFDGTPDLSGQE